MTLFGDLGCPGVDVDEWRKQNRVPLFPGKVNRWVLVRTTLQVGTDAQMQDALDVIRKMAIDQLSEAA